MNPFFAVVDGVLVVLTVLASPFDAVMGLIPSIAEGIGQLQSTYSG